MFYCHQAAAVTSNRTAAFCDELQEVLRLLMDLGLPLYGQPQEGIAPMKAIGKEDKKSFPFKNLVVHLLKIEWG